jgi:hypothetical protein
MASLWDKMKNTGTTAKLKGEIMLLEREKKVRKEQFGRDLYDLLNSEKGGNIFLVKTPSIFHSKEEAIRQPFERCKNNVESLLLDKHGHRQEIDRLQIDRERALPPTSNREKLDKAGQWVASTSAEGKHTAQIALLDRRIAQRKGEFGLEVYDAMHGDSRGLGDDSSGRGNAVRAAVSTQLSKLSQKEKEIEDCVEQARKDVETIDRKIQSKRQEIRVLGEVL